MLGVSLIYKRGGFPILFYVCGGDYRMTGSTETCDVLTDEEKAALKHEFNKMDKDQSGTLDKEELKFFYRKALAPPFPRQAGVWRVCVHAPARCPAPWRPGATSPRPYRPCRTAGLPRRRGTRRCLVA